MYIGIQTYPSSESGPKFLAIGSNDSLLILGNLETNRKHWTISISHNSRHNVALAIFLIFHLILFIHLIKSYLIGVLHHTVVSIIVGGNQTEHEGTRQSTREPDRARGNQTEHEEIRQSRRKTHILPQIVGRPFLCNASLNFSE